MTHASLTFTVALIAPFTICAVSGCGGRTSNEAGGAAETGGATASVGLPTSPGGAQGTGDITAAGGSSASGGKSGTLATGGTTRVGGVITFKCGDGEVNPGEVCDQGQYQGSPGCSGDCMTQEPGYVCYPGQQCFSAYVCGDGILEFEWGEQCEPASPDDPNCTADCQPVGSCGDGVTNGLEQCDFGTEWNLGDYGGCASNCIAGPYCGDGVTNGPEQCDFGTEWNLGDYGGCTSNCQLGPHCGDGVTNGNEECDDGSGAEGNGSPWSRCTITCKRYVYS